MDTVNFSPMYVQNDSSTYNRVIPLSNRDIFLRSQPPDMSISAPLNNRPHPSGSRASPPARDTSVNHAPRNSVNSFSSAPSPPPGVNQYPPMQHPAPRPTGKRPMAPAPIMPSPFPPLSVAIPPPPTSPQVGKRRRVSQKWGSLINNLLAAVAQQTPGEQDGKGSESPAAIPDSPGSLMALTSDVASELGSKIAALRKRRFSMGSAREMQIMRVTTNQQYWNSTWSVRTDCCNPILLQNQSKPFRRADELVSIHLQTPEPVTASVRFPLFSVTLHFTSLFSHLALFPHHTCHKTTLFKSYLNTNKYALFIRPVLVYGSKIRFASAGCCLRVSLPCPPVFMWT